MDRCDLYENGTIHIKGVAAAERDEPELFDSLGGGSTFTSTKQNVATKEAQESHPVLAMLEKSPSAEVDNNSCKKLISLMQDCEEDAMLMERILVLVGNMSKTEFNRTKLGAHGFLKIICHLMELHELQEGLQLSACFAMGTLCAGNDANRAALLESNGLQIVVSALGLNLEHSKLVKSALFCLINLFAKEDCRKKLAAYSASSSSSFFDKNSHVGSSQKEPHIQCIMDLVRHPTLATFGDVQTFACAVLANLATDDAHCISMADSGAARQANANDASANLLPNSGLSSSALPRQKDVVISKKVFVDALLRMMELHIGKFEPCLIQAALLLFKLTNSSISHAICQDLEENDATDVIVLGMESFPASSRLQEYLTGILSKISASDRVQREFVSKAGIQILLEVMKKNGDNQALQMYACSVLLRLSTHEAHRKAQLDSGALGVARRAVKHHGLQTAKQLVVELSVDQGASDGFRNCWVFFSAPKHK